MNETLKLQMRIASLREELSKNHPADVTMRLRLQIHDLEAQLNPVRVTKVVAVGDAL